MPYDIRLVTLQPRPAIVIRGTMRAEALPGFFGGAYAELYAYAGRCGAAPDGPPFARYPGITTAAVGPEITVEAGVTLQRAVEGAGRIESSELPGGDCAVTEHVGPYDTMEPAYKAIEEWMRAHGREPASGPWEIYHSDPAEEPDPQKWRTDIHWRLK
jgi:effector-binding domain-containing protein